MPGPNTNWDQVSAVTEKLFLPKLVDNVFKSTPLLSRMQKRVEKQSGGTKIMVPLNYAQSSAGGWYSGADTLDNTDSDTITAAEFEWKQIHEPISITRRDELINSGQAAKVNFVKSKMKIAEKSIKDKVAVGLWNNGTTSKAILGVRSFLSTSNSYGNISQTSASWWQANVDAATTTQTIGAVQALHSAAGLNGDSVTVILSGSTRYDSYYLQLQPQQRFTDAKTASGGFTALMFNGVPWIVDSKAPSTHVVGLNEDALHFIVHQDEDFRMEPFAKPINQNVQVAHIYAMLAFASDNNRTHFALTALTA